MTDAQAAETEDQDEFEGEETGVEAATVEPQVVTTAPVEQPVAAASREELPVATVTPVIRPPVVAPAPAFVPAPVVLPPMPVAAVGITTLRTPHMITVPEIVAVPVVQPAPLPIEQLQPVLELAGLTLVQTEPAKHAEAMVRLASEQRPPRKPRERPSLPPMQDGPLVQVETRPTSAPQPGA